MKFGKTDITRLIIGSNPFYGYSHFNKILDQSMREWYTQDRRMEVLHDCERHGINTWQVHYDPQLPEDFKRYRAEGGRMHLVLLAQGTGGRREDPGAAGYRASRQPHRRPLRNGEKGKVRDFVKAVRDTAVMAGISTHNPAVVDTVESEGWQVDYYQTCFYRVTRTAEEARVGRSKLRRRSRRRSGLLSPTSSPPIR